MTVLPLKRTPLFFWVFFNLLFLSFINFIFILFIYLIIYIYFLFFFFGGGHYEIKIMVETIMLLHTWNIYDSHNWIMDIHNCTVGKYVCSIMDNTIWNPL